MIVCKSLPIFVGLFKEMSLKEGSTTVEDPLCGRAPRKKILHFYSPVVTSSPALAQKVLETFSHISEHKEVPAPF